MLLVHSAPRSRPIRNQPAPHTEVPAWREGTSLLTELELPWGRCTPVKSGFESLEVDCLIVPGNLARAKSLKDRRHWFGWSRLGRGNACCWASYRAYNAQTTLYLCNPPTCARQESPQRIPGSRVPWPLRSDYGVGLYPAIILPLRAT